MDETGVENSPPRIIHRKNARNVAPQQAKKEDSRRESSLGSKAASLVLAGLAVGGGAAVVDEINVDNKSASASAMQEPTEAKVVEPQAQTQEKVQESPSLFDTVFHDLDEKQLQEAQELVGMFKEKIAAKSDYEKAHREIPLKYKSQIEQTAKAYGLSEDMLLGIIAIENGGGTDVTNKYSGARGVAQFLPDTARQYGLRVNENFDERTDPVKSIAAAGKYLEDHKDLFGGDEGLTIWSYHAGVGNVFNAMRVYFLDTYNEDIGSYSGAIVANDAQARLEVETKALELMEKDKLSFYKLASNAAVKEKVIANLDDFSETYVPQVVALRQLEEEKADREVDLGGGLRIEVPRNTFPSSR